MLSGIASVSMVGAPFLEDSIRAFHHLRGAEASVADGDAPTK